MRTLVGRQSERPRGTTGLRSFSSTDAFVLACALGISVGTLATAIMLLASLAFSQALTIAIPFIATFHGFLDSTGTNAVSITGSWLAVGILVVVETVTIWALARLFRHRSTWAA